MTPEDISITNVDLAKNYPFVEEHARNAYHNLKQNVTNDKVGI